MLVENVLLENRRFYKLVEDNIKLQHSPWPRVGRTGTSGVTEQQTTHVIIPELVLLWGRTGKNSNAAGLCMTAANLDSVPLRTSSASLDSECTGCRICLLANELVLFQALLNSAVICG